VSGVDRTAGGFYGNQNSNVRRALYDLERRAVLVDRSVKGKLDQGDAANDINANAVTISGGKLTAGSVTTLQLAANAIRSLNYQEGSGDFSAAGSFFNLAEGDIIAPGLRVVGASGAVKVRGEVTATSMAVRSPSDSGREIFKISAENAVDSEGSAIQIFNADLVGSPTNHVRPGVLAWTSGTRPLLQLASPLASGYTDGNQPALDLKWRGSQGGEFDLRTYRGTVLGVGSASLARIRGYLSAGAPTIDVTADTVNVSGVLKTANVELTTFGSVGVARSISGDLLLTTTDTSSARRVRVQRTLDCESSFTLGGSTYTKLPKGGSHSGTTTTSGAITVTHNLSMPTHTVVISPTSPNGTNQSTRWVGWNVTSTSSNSFTIGRCVAQDGTLLTSTSVSFRYALIPYG
jgi:hypothetical protein